MRSPGSTRLLIVLSLALMASSVGAGPLATAATNPTDPSSERQAIAPVELLVKYADGASGGFTTPAKKQARDQLNARIGAVHVRELAASSIEVVRLKKGTDVDAAIAAYEQTPGVELAEPNEVYSTQLDPGDTHFKKQWALHNTGQTGGRRDADIDAPEAWQATTGSRSVVVVVIDTGIDFRHPDLAANVWTNPGEVPGDRRDNDHNGYVDDVHGYDAVDEDGDPSDPNGHGTHVAGTIGATGHNRIGVAGVNWKVSIAGCRFLDEGGEGTTDGAIACLDYVDTLRQAGVPVIATNNSWSGVGDSALLKRAIRQLPKVLFVAAAGNTTDDLDQAPVYPARFELPNVISVAATDDSDHQARFSNFGGATVGLSAPGVDIVSLRASGTDLNSDDGQSLVPAGDPNAKYYRASGTSMAAPHVAGVAALVKARFPRMGWRGIRNRILAGSDPVAPLESSTITGRRLNANGALRCEDRRVFAPVGVPPAFPLLAGKAVTVRALNIDCGRPGGPVQVVTSDGTRIRMRDDGVAPDLGARDGLYAATVRPRQDLRSLVFTSREGRVAIPGVSFGRYLPEGRVGTAYHFTLRPFGATAPLRWSVVDGSLPAGLRLTATGVIAGTPTKPGRSLLRLRLSDGRGRVAVKEVGLNVTQDSVTERLIAIDRARVPIVPQGHAVDGSGNTIVVGYYEDPRSHDQDFAITKYSPTGAVLWRNLRTSTTKWWANWARAVTVDEAGNSYVVGGYPYFRADSDLMLVKYSPDGRELWSTSYDGGEVELPSAITFDPSGDLVVTGRSSSGGGSSALTVKFHPSGELVWAKKFKAGAEDHGFDLGVDAAGNVYVAGGSLYITSTTELFTSQSYSYLLLKYSPSGELLWSKYNHDLDAHSLAAADAIAVDAAGNSYLGGPIGGPLRKYDADGNLVWEAPPTTEHDFDIRDLALDRDGDVLVAGSFYDAAEQVHVHSLIKLDPSSTGLWSRRMAGDLSDAGIDISVDASDLLRVTLPSDQGTVLTTFRSTLGLTTTTLPPALRGIDYHHRLRATGGVRPLAWRVTSGELPAGISLDSATGELVGAAAEGGTFPITVSVEDADGASVSRDYTLQVDYLAIDPVADPTLLTLNEAWSQELVVNGTAGPFSWAVIGDLPPGLTLRPATGVLSGTPTAGGSYPVTIEAMDAEGHTARLRFTITVLEPLTVVTTALPDAAAGQPYTLTLEATGGRPPYRWGWYGNQVPGLELSDVTGEITGIPTTPGSYETGVFVMDSRGIWTTRALTLVVN